MISDTNYSECPLWGWFFRIMSRSRLTFAAVKQFLTMICISINLPFYFLVNNSNVQRSQILFQILRFGKYLFFAWIPCWTDCCFEVDIIFSIQIGFSCWNVCLVVKIYTDCDAFFLSYRASKIRLWLKASLSLWSAISLVILSLLWHGTGKTTRLRALWTSRSLSKQGLLALWFVKPLQKTVEDLPALLPIRLGVSAHLATYMWKVSIFITVGRP